MVEMSEVCLVEATGFFATSLFVAMSFSMSRLAVEADFECATRIVRRMIVARTPC